MTIQYKNAGFNLSDTSQTTALTSPTSGRCLIKQIQAHNNHSGSVT